MKYKMVLMTVLATTVFSSCKKDRSCECITTTVSTIFSNSTTTKNYTYKKVTRKQIKTLCVSYKEEYNGGSITVDCTIK